MADPENINGQGVVAPVGDKTGAPDGAQPREGGQVGAGDSQAHISEEDAKNLRTQRDRAFSEVQQLKAQLAAREEMKSTLSEVMGEAKEKQDQQALFEQQRKGVVDRLTDAGLDESVAEQLTETLIELSGDVRTQVTSHADKLLAEKLGVTQKELEALKAQVATVDPEYAPYKEAVEQMATELGMDPVKDRDTLVKFVKHANAGKIAQPDRPPLAGSAGNGRTPVHGSADIGEDGINAMLAVAGMTPLSDEEKVALRGGK